MKMDGTTHIAATRDVVFACLTDAAFVAECAPDVQRLDELEAGKRYRVIAGIGFGAVKAAFDTEFEFLDKRPNDYARIKGAGRAPGSTVDIQAELFVSDAAAGGTELRWVADVTIAGALAAVAARLLDTVAQQLSVQFFAVAKQRIEQRGEG